LVSLRSATGANDLPNFQVAHALLGEECLIGLLVTNHVGGLFVELDPGKCIAR